MKSVRIRAKRSVAEAALYDEDECLETFESALWGR